MAISRCSLAVSSLEALVNCHGVAVVGTNGDGNGQDEDSNGEGVALPGDNWVDVVIHFVGTQEVGEHVEEESPYLDSPVTLLQLDVTVVDIEVVHDDWQNVAVNVHGDVPGQEVIHTQVMIGGLMSLHHLYVVSVIRIWERDFQSYWKDHWEENAPETNDDTDVGLLSELEPDGGSGGPVVWVSLGK